MPDQTAGGSTAPLGALTLLSGDAQAFLTKVWATTVHVHRGDPLPLTGLLTFDDVDELLTGTAIRTPAVRVARDGQVLAPSTYTRHATLAGQPLSGLVDPARIFTLVEEGASVVLQGLHRYWRPLGALVADLELALGHPCQANAYLTPPGSQGFAVHEDSHDVFVFQTHGSKLWEVHPPRGQDGEPSTVLLEPGVSMYLPTGTPHAARAQQDVSLHVTIGINQLTWRPVVERALTAALGGGGDEHLPAGWLEEPALLADGLADRLEALAAAVRSLEPAAVADMELRRFLTGRTLWQRGGLRDRVGLDSLADDTLLVRRPGHPCVLRPEGERLRVLLGDRDLVVPARLAGALERVRAAGALRPGDLADLLDGQSRLVLCRRLVREGLLTLATGDDGP
ncbi:MAG: cupin domain-containing protein [Nocardioidaceae bacterium]